MIKKSPPGLKLIDRTLLPIRCVEISSRLSSDCHRHIISCLSLRNPALTRNVPFGENAIQPVKEIMLNGVIIYHEMKELTNAVFMNLVQFFYQYCRFDVPNGNSRTGPTFSDCNITFKTDTFK